MKTTCGRDGSPAAGCSELSACSTQKHPDSDDAQFPSDGTDSFSALDADTDSDTDAPEDTGEPRDTATAEEPEDSETRGNNETALYKKCADCFPVGAVIDNYSYKDAHAGVMKEHFNSTVSENEMKWSALRASEGAFNFSQADQMVQFAENNGMLVRGHVLVWHDPQGDRADCSDALKSVHHPPMVA